MQQRFYLFFEISFISANFEPHVVKELPVELETGVYFGWAQIDNGIVHKMVMSVGWNPYYKNVEKSMVSNLMYKAFTFFILQYF